MEILSRPPIKKKICRNDTKNSHIKNSSDNPLELCLSSCSY